MRRRRSSTSPTTSRSLRGAVQRGRVEFIVAVPEPGVAGDAGARCRRRTTRPTFERCKLRLGRARHARRASPPARGPARAAPRRIAAFREQAPGARRRRRPRGRGLRAALCRARAPPTSACCSSTSGATSWPRRSPSRWSRRRTACRWHVSVVERSTRSTAAAARRTSCSAGWRIPGHAALVLKPERRDGGHRAG